MLFNNVDYISNIIECWITELAQCILNEIFKRLVNTSLILEKLATSEVPEGPKPLVMDTLDILLSDLVDQIIDILPLWDGIPIGNKSSVLSRKIQSNMSVNKVFEGYVICWFGIVVSNDVKVAPVVRLFLVFSFFQIWLLLVSSRVDLVKKEIF